MVSKPLRVLIVEDSEDDVLLTIHALKKGGYKPTYERVEDAVAMRKALETEPWDVILCDYQMPKFDGLAAIALLKDTGIDLPLIIISGAIGEETAVECMLLGAHDYLIKGNLSRLVPAIKRELKEAESRRQRKKAEKKLAERTKRLDLAQTVAKSGIWDWDIVTGHIEWSNQMFALFGLDPHSTTASFESWRSAIHPEDVEIAGQRIDSALKERTHLNSDYRILLPDGQIRWINAVGECEYDDRDRPVRMIGICIDITERKRTEEALHHERNRAQGYLDTVETIIVALNNEGRITSINRKGCQLFGCEEDELIGQLWFSTCLPQPDGMEKVFPFFLSLVSDKIEEAEYFENPVVTRSGELRHIAWHNALLHDERGGVIGTLSSGEDITEHKRAEKALAESEERYRFLFDAVPVGIGMSDWEGAVLTANQTMQQITGYTLEEFKKISIGDTYVDLNERRQMLQVLREFGVVRNYEVSLRRKDGTVYFALLNIDQIEHSGRKVFLTAIRDITEHKQAEERYRSIFENAQEGIYRSTPAGRIIMANQAMANMFGYKTPEELMTNVTDVARQFYVHPEERTKLKEIIEEHGSVKNYETQFYRKDGTSFWVSMTMQGVRDPSGQILYYDGIDEDITSRKESAERMRRSLGATVQAIAVIVETRDPYTAGHQRKVADLARAIATEMKLPANRIDGIRMASYIHDLGKISVPAEILSNPKKLTTLEFSLIKTHARSGYDILKDIEFPWPVARMVLEHHERMDGSGYPWGLKGDEIIIESRILAIADVVEAMASHRPYRPAIGLNAALAEIEHNKGTLYDVDAVDACLRLFREKGFRLEGT